MKALKALKALKGLGALGALGVVAVTPIASDAQACLGLRSFSAGGVQLGVTGGRAKDVKGIGVGLTFGSPAGAVGGPSLVTVSYDDLDGNTIVVGGSVGWQIPVDAARRIQLRSRVSIRPSVGLPLGLEDGDPSVEVIAALNF